MKVLNFGSLNVDYVYKVDHVVAKGETLSASERNIFCGGKGLNQSVACGRAGVETCHAGNIGAADTFLLDILTSAGVDISLIRKLDDIPSGHAIIQNSSDGDNCILLFGGANQAVSDAQVDETIAKFAEGDYLILQNEINNIAYIMEKAHAQGMKIVLNPSPMNEKITALPLECVDWFLLNEIEAAQITGGTSEDPEALLEALISRFPNANVVLTLGSQGSICMSGGTITRQNAFHVKAVDTTAAGDTFTGYFIAGVIAGDPIEKCMETAAKASAISVTRNGAAPSIPTAEEVRGTCLL